ncbi:MAG: MBL fold metallo-hydrolase [Candidatus Nomurabacteria bacterium]|jgi:ribonuclease Z|nr:MBL fold metallo-hydrolase [Candidatus Nomurabacteria bacterium]
MNRMVFLGTSAATAGNSYNACFALAGDDGKYLLVDGGGGGEIINRLAAARIAVTDISNIFVTHNHIDHIFGVIWVIRRLAISAYTQGFAGPVDIYAQAMTIRAIQTLVELVLSEAQIEASQKILNYVTVGDRETADIGGRPAQFYDVQSGTESQFGIKLALGGGKSLVYNGDELLKEPNYDLARGVDWLVHEVFVLEADRATASRGGKPFTTAKTICELAQQLGAKNLILTHIKDDLYGPDRKARFIAEGRTYYPGRLFIPNDGDVIKLTKACV